MSKGNGLSDGLRAVRSSLATTAVFGFFINLLAFVSPLYMLQIYDRVITSRNETTLVGLTLIAGYLLLVYALLELFRSRLMVRAGRSFDEHLAKPVFDAVHRANMQRPAGSHGQSLRDLDTLRDFIAGAPLVALLDTPWMPLFVAVCFLLHPLFGWIAIGGALVIAGLTLASEFWTSKTLAAANRASVVAAQRAAATLRNGEVLQAMGMLSALRQRWSDRHAEALVLQSRAGARAGVLTAGSKFTRTMLQTAVLGTGAYLAIHREISPGVIVAASIVIGRSLAPIESVIANWKAVTAARGAYKRLGVLLSSANTAARLDLPAPLGRLTLENLVVGPPGGAAPVLRGLSLDLSPGEVLGVVGPSAAGKSSLARAMTGVWPAWNGTVRLDGANLQHWDFQKLGPHLGYLPQDVELFAGSVAENIARFGPVDADAVVDVADLTGCHDMILRLPNGYDTQIGEGGSALSGGQRQRIGLARAFYGRPVFVVLDEPNASLDSAGEEALLAAIKRFRSFRSTIVVITHRANVLAAADKVLLLVDGTIKRIGPREEILAPTPLVAVAS